MKTVDSQKRPVATALGNLSRPLRLTWAALFAERIVRGFWPFWTLALAVAAALSFGVQDMLAPGIFAWGLLVAAVAVFAAFVGALWRFSPPSRIEALARLDGSLPGRPLAALADRQVIGTADPASELVWKAHLAQMAQRAAQARPVPPNLRLAARDPFALRYVALLAFVMAVAFGAPQRVSEFTVLADPLRGSGDALAHGPSWEAWVQPPAYTGRPSLYLNEVARPTLSLPEGSRVTMRLYGAPGVLSIHETVSDTDEGELAESGADSAIRGFEIARAGRISIRGPAGRDWEVVVEYDAPPAIRFAGEMTRESGGRMRQPFTATDDHGVVAGEAEITLDLDAVDRSYGLALPPETRAPILLDLPMPISGDRAEFTEALIGDLSRHPWANLPVRVRLTAEDAMGQTGETGHAEVVLPGRRFFDPLAGAIVEMRRDLLWNADSAQRVVQVLRAVSHRPDDLFRNDASYLKLRFALRELEGAVRAGTFADGQRDEIAEILWEIAVEVEEGDMADALERLRRAQERLSEAMRSGADDAEIAELMDEMREAMRDYMRQLAEQPRDRDSQEAEGGERMEISGAQLQELLDRIQELMEQGRMAEAAELMEQLNQLLENMQVAEGEGGEPGPGQDALDGLAETLREQQGLADGTFRDLQERYDPGAGTGEGPGEGQGEGGQDEAGGQSLSERQGLLRDELNRQQGRELPGEGSEAGDAARQALEDAARAMEQAEEALRDGEGAEALDRQADAIEALREGMRRMGEAMAEGDGEPGGSENPSQGAGGRLSDRDPLGRETGHQGQVGTDEDMLQGADVYRRAREILEEIRRRSAEQDRPGHELDYLRRLLDRF